jgi:hypothetical protein
MAGAQQFIWYWSRKDEKPSSISGEELRLLAELGHLRPEDLLWRPGFESWRPANSVPGILLPPPIPKSAGIIAKWSAPPWAPIRQLVSFYLRWVFRRSQLRLAAGLLLFLFCVASLALAIRIALATDTSERVANPVLKQESVALPTDTSERVANPVLKQESVASQTASTASTGGKPLKYADSVASNTISILRRADQPVSCSSILLTNGAILEPNPKTEASLLKPTLVSWAESEAVPLPTRKPPRRLIKAKEARSKWRPQPRQEFRGSF